MKTVATRKLWKRRGLVGVGLALVGAALAVAIPRALAQQEEAYAGRIALVREVAKLGIVVMANQTPISAGEAASVVPALEAIRAVDTFTEPQAVEMQSRLHAALSSPLQAAVEKVRLPEVPPHARAVVIARAERMGVGNPAHSGPGSMAFGRLLEFFRQTAAEYD